MQVMGEINRAGLRQVALVSTARRGARADGPGGGSRPRRRGGRPCRPARGADLRLRHGRQSAAPCRRRWRSPSSTRSASTSASPEPSAEPAAAARAPEIGPVEDAAPTPAPTRRARRRGAAPAPQPAPAPPRPAAARPAPPAPPAPAQRTRRPGLGDLDPRSFGRDPAARSSRAPAAAMSAQAAADIGSAITRQVQPCADRQVDPGPGAERIVTPLSLRLNRDGSLAARPRVGRQRGLDDENRRYAQRVADLAVAAFVACSPLRGLPAGALRRAARLEQFHHELSFARMRNSNVRISWIIAAACSLARRRRRLRADAARAAPQGQEATTASSSSTSPAAAARRCRSPSPTCRRRRPPTPPPATPQALGRQVAEIVATDLRNSRPVHADRAERPARRSPSRR